MATTEKEEIEAKMESLRNEMNPLRNRLEEITTMEKDEKCKKWIGKCFAFPNSYGRGHDDDNWTYYLKIMGSEDGYFLVLTCQEYPNGKVEIKTVNRVLRDFEGEYVNEDYIARCEITPKEFKEHYLSILSKTTM